MKGYFGIIWLSIFTVQKDIMFIRIARHGKFLAQFIFQRLEQNDIVKSSETSMRLAKMDIHITTVSLTYMGCPFKISERC